MLADDTTLNPKEAETAVYQLEKVVSRLLLDGHTVQLGDLGTFNLTINAEGQQEEKKVSADDIKKVNLRFRISKTMREASTRPPLNPLKASPRRRSKSIKCNSLLADGHLVSARCSSHI